LGYESIEPERVSADLPGEKDKVAACEVSFLLGSGTGSESTIRNAID
jgi:hypothetical protein